MYACAKMGDARSMKERLRDRFPAMAERNFRIFSIGQAISLIGTWMQSTALPLFAYRLTGEALDLGIVGFATFLPVALFTLPAGLIADRMPKRKVVLLCQIVMMAQALALGVLAAEGVVTIRAITALSFVLGTANAFDVVARQAMLVELVGRPALPNAIALNSTLNTVARVLGPALAAPLVLFSGEAGAFFANAASYLCVIIGLIILRTPYAGAKRDAAGADGLAAAWEYLRGARMVRSLLWMGAAFGFVAVPLPNLVPVFASDVFGSAGDAAADIAARNSALFVATGIGSVVAAVLVAASSKHPRRGAILLSGQVLFSLTLIAFASTRLFPVALVLLLFVGFGSVVQLALVNTLIQLTVPDGLRSRVISILVLGIQGAAPFGAIATGAIAGHISAPAAALVAGIVYLGFNLALHLRAPEIWRASTDRS